ncbi:MAG: arsenate reductase ArsC [Pseudobdellovibrionaceae bacterium]
MNNKPIHILFLCVANSARSQLAEGLAKSIFGTHAVIESAGSEPSGKVQAWATKVLEEEGIDISKNRSKSINELSTEFLSNLDFLITLCAEEVCPVLPSKARRLHWPIPDPASASEESKPQAFREAKNQIRANIEKLKSEWFE